jgi:hypothetical protein
VIDNAVICGVEHVKKVPAVTPPESADTRELPVPWQVRRPWPFTVATAGALLVHSAVEVIVAVLPFA